MIKNKTYLPLTSVNKGFSLIELIIIMTIIGIMIAASTTRIKDITINARVSAAINQITADIDQAKTMSMSMRKQIEIIFNQTNETYNLGWFNFSFFIWVVYTNYNYHIKIIKY